MDKSGHRKQPRLPPTHRISKRALIRPPIPSPYRSAASPKVIWVRVRTPLRSTVARVDKLLDQVRQRSTDAPSDQSLLEKGRVGKAAAAAKPKAATAAARASKDAAGQTDHKLPEAIHLKGAGRALARVLEIGAWFQQRPERYHVHLRTGETSVVDDVVRVEDGTDGEDTSGVSADEEEKLEDVEMEDAGEGVGQGVANTAHSSNTAEQRDGENIITVPTRRLRALNTLEVQIRLA